MIAKFKAIVPVLIGFCLVAIVFGLWLTAAHWERQQALRWWFIQETIDLTAHSDQIQNQLIQDLFALRLSLQSVAPDSAELALRQQDWLAKTAELHSHLAKLSTTLIPPYLAESLPLAIQSQLHHWQLAHPDCQLQLTLPLDWQPESAEHSRLLLRMLETILSLAISPALPATRLQISLCDRSIPEMRFTITYVDSQTRSLATDTQELKYLRHCFHALIPGRCYAQHRSHQATWRFQWQR